MYEVLRIVRMSRTADETEGVISRTLTYGWPASNVWLAVKNPLPISQERRRYVKNHGG